MATSILRNEGLAFIEIKEGAWEDYPIRTHSHEELQIGFVERGSSRITCKLLAFEMKADQAILIPPDIIHLCQPDEMSKFKFTILYIAPKWFESSFRLDVSRFKPQTTQLDQQTLEMKDEFVACYRRQSRPPPLPETNRPHLWRVDLSGLLAGVIF
jgi:quercetin dioxygenase-like cupin family protein